MNAKEIIDEQVKFVESCTNLVGSTKPVDGESSDDTQSQFIIRTIIRDGIQDTALRFYTSLSRTDREVGLVNLIALAIVGLRSFGHDVSVVVPENAVETHGSRQARESMEDFLEKLIGEGTPTGEDEKPETIN